MNPSEAHDRLFTIGEAFAYCWDAKARWRGDWQVTSHGASVTDLRQAVASGELPTVPGGPRGGKRIRAVDLVWWVDHRRRQDIAPWVAWAVGERHLSDVDFDRWPPSPDPGPPRAPV